MKKIPLNVLVIFFLIPLLFVATIIGVYYMAKKEPVIVKKESIKKGVVVHNKFMEGTPFDLRGSLYFLISERNDKEKKYTLAIYDYKKNTRVSPSFGDGLSLASAFVDNNTLYIFGTKNWVEFGKSEIYEIRTTDLKNFSEPTVIYSAHEKQKIFNTSVTKNTDLNKYIMAIEVDEEGSVPFTIRFLESDDLSYWEVENMMIFGKQSYVACPTIKYSEGFYYLLFGKEYFYDPNCLECKTYITEIARSKNLIDWKTSSSPLLIPNNNGKEGISAADVDLVEYEGVTHFLYSISDQATWGGLKKAEFNGKMQSLFDLFFK